jgi:hypothetical protein
MNWYRIIAIIYLLAAAGLIYYGVSSKLSMPAGHQGVWTDKQVKYLVMGSICAVMAAISLWLGKKKKAS